MFSTLEHCSVVSQVDRAKCKTAKRKHNKSIYEQCSTQKSLRAVRDNLNLHTEAMKGVAIDGQPSRDNRRHQHQCSLSQNTYYHSKSTAQHAHGLVLGAANTHKKADKYAFGLKKKTRCQTITFELEDKNIIKLNSNLNCCNL